MPVSVGLFRRLYDTFGDEIANGLVEWFNQVDTTDCQESRERNALNWSRIEARTGEMETRIGASSKMNSAISALTWMWGWNGSGRTCSSRCSCCGPGRRSG
jgi:hypothetical protein